MTSKSCLSPEKWILTGIPVLFLSGSLIHFLYDLTGQSTLAALFAPVNESVWEHSKLILWPVILWWPGYYYFCKRPADAGRWFGGALVSLLTALALMPMLYYFYTGAFGREFLWADILILLACLAAGQFLGLHIYRRSGGISPCVVLTVIAAIVLVFLAFTFFPPHFPWFQDPLSGRYGIS